MSWIRTVNESEAEGLLRKIYNEYKDEDGFLYIKYTAENTYG